MSKWRKFSLHLNKAAIIILGSLYFAFAPTVEIGEAVIKTDTLNVRLGPGIDFKRVGKVYSGEVYPIQKQENGWIQIKTTALTGWVASRYTEVKRNPLDQVSSKKKSSTFDSAQSNKSHTVNGLQQKTIVLDAGHGGRDSGAISASGANEKIFTRATVQNLEQLLTTLGAKVILTRKDDRFVSLAGRAALANIADADAFISIHYNSFPQAPSVTGTGTYYYTGQDKSLARSVQKGMIKATGADDRGISEGDFQVLRQNTIPAILVESGFISNAKQEQLFSSSMYQKQLASGIAMGLNDYFLAQ
ncbi:N-acetylmuramoyl-L-alanine amidase [Lentibacillus cibarius]|uniref:N-acetylmuramoyl-L-alanine amidase n=1 Tax=Lentibacillus cibarius TaxID=2583219 RepID=A0A5S3QIK3_9BACI|nr:N-acetylmuramoyl-L-alanine amidase [Lentibacillus cibarius]